jgi:ubiquitin-conjugating enzyme E2 D/E
MRIKVALTQPSSQVVNIPCDASITVAALIANLKRRVTNLPAVLELYFDGGKLFEEDTLADLGIKEGDTLTDTLSGASNPQPATPNAQPTTTTTPQQSVPASVPVVPDPSSQQPDNTAAGDSGNAGAPAPPPPTTTDATAPAAPTVDSGSQYSAPPRTIAEVVMVCFDISSSMHASFVTDLDPGLGSSSVSRVAAAKICFGAFIDKTLAYEYPHAVGLIVFGSSIREKIPISNNLNKFEQIFGELDDSEGSTRLYPAVQLAVDKILEYKAELKRQNVDLRYVKYRIIAFTDGEDNSGMHAFDVAPLVIQQNIIVDAVVIGGSDSAHHPLRSLAHCTGGWTIRIPEIRSALNAVFEREAVLALSERQINKPDVKSTIKLAEFLEFGDMNKYPIISHKGLETSSVSAAAVTQAATTAKAVSLSSNANAPIPTATATSNIGSGAVKRITAELKAIQQAGTTWYEVFVTEDNLADWKVIIKGPDGTPYAGYHWVLRAMFPTDYPFKPPKLQWLTSIYHCNVSSEGRICLNVLHDSWSPSITFPKIMENIKVMMVEPDTLDALDAWKGSLARTDPDEYKKQALEHTKQHASDDVAKLKAKFNIA